MATDVMSGLIGSVAASELAAADMVVADGTLDPIIDEARKLLAIYPRPLAWALVAARIVLEECEGDVHPQSIVEMLALAAIRLAQA